MLPCIKTIKSYCLLPFAEPFPEFTLKRSIALSFLRKIKILKIRVDARLTFPATPPPPKQQQQQQQQQRKIMQLEQDRSRQGLVVRISYFVKW